MRGECRCSLDEVVSIRVARRRRPVVYLKILICEKLGLDLVEAMTLSKEAVEELKAQLCGDS